MRALETRYGRAALLEALRDETRRCAPASRSGEVAAITRGRGGRGDRARHRGRRLRAAMRAVAAAASSTPPASSSTPTSGGRRCRAAALDARARRSPRGYTNLEYDLGARAAAAARDVHAETLLARLTGAEAAIVVNNNAAATLLVLAALARRTRGDHLARRAGGDRRRLPRARRDGAVGRDAARSGHDQPHARRRLRGRDHARDRRCSCACIRPTSGS